MHAYPYQSRMKHILIEGDPTKWTPEKMLARLEKDGADTLTVYWGDADERRAAIVSRDYPGRVVMRTRNGNNATSIL